MSTRQVTIARWRNVLWPIQRARKGWQQDTLQLRYNAALYSLLRTKRGALLWAPDFGVNLEQFRTQGLTEQHINLLQVEIQVAVRRWIPDIQITDIQATKDPSTEDLVIHVLWGIPDSVLQPFGDQRQSTFLFDPIWTTVQI